MRAFLQTCIVILRPWAIAVAILAAAEAVFLPQPTGYDVGMQQFGTDVLVESTDGPLRRALSFSWNSRPAKGETVDWRVEGGDFGLQWTYGSWGLPLDHRGVRTSRVRAARIAFLSMRTDLLWWLGLPLIGSAVGIWRLHQERSAGFHEPAANTEGLPWRLARPWVWAFAPIGVVLLTLGGKPWATGAPAFWHHSERSLAFVRGTADTQSARSLFVWEKTFTNVSYGTPASLETTGRQWAFELPGMGLVRSVSEVRTSDLNVDFVVSRRQGSLSVWWLVAVPAAFNLVTLARLIRRRGRAGPAVPAG